MAQNLFSQILDRITGVVADKRKKDEEERKRREANSRIIKQEEEWRGKRQIYSEQSFDPKVKRQQEEAKKLEEQKKKTALQQTKDQVARTQEALAKKKDKNLLENLADKYAGVSKTILDSGLVSDDLGFNVSEAIAKVGRLAQKFPDTTIRTRPDTSSQYTKEELDQMAKRTGIPASKDGDPRYKQYTADILGAQIPVTELGGKAIPFLSSIPGEIVRSYGKTSERLATEKGREEIIKGAKAFPGEAIELAKKRDPEAAAKLLQNPATQTGFDVSDFIPGIGFVSLGVKKGTKEVVEKGVKEAIEKEAEKKATQVTGKSASELPLTSDGLDASLRPENKTSIAETGDPSSARATIVSPSTATDTRVPSNKYVPGTSASDILDDPSFISKYNSTIQEKPYVEDVLKEAADGREIVSTTKDINTTAEKIVRKIKSKPEYSEEYVGDMVRGSIKAADTADVGRVLAKLRGSENVEVLSVENYIDSPNPWGYQGINVNIKTPKGNIAEIQIHTPESTAIQKALHPLYEKWRTSDTIPVSVFNEAADIVAKIKSGSPKVDELPLTSPKLTEDGLRVTTRPGSYSNVAAIDNPLINGPLKKADELPLTETKAIEKAADVPAGGSMPPASKPGGEPMKPEDIIIDDRGKLTKVKDPNKYEFDLKSLNTPDDVKNTILGVARAGNASIQEGRRGTIPFAQTRAMADALGMTVKDVENRMPGRIFNAEQADAATRLALKVQEDLTNIGKEIAALKEAGKPIPEELLAEQMEAAARAKGVLTSVLGSRSESARALNAAKMMKEALESGDSKLQKEAMRMFAGDEKKATEVIAKLSEFDPEDSLGKIQFLKSVKPSTPLDKIEELWYNSVLSGPATHVVNNVGNAMATFMRLPEKAASVAIDNALGKLAKLFNKEYKQDHFAAQMGAEIAGVRNGMTKGVRKGLYVMRNGISEADVTKFDIGRTQAIKGKKGAVINIPSRALAAADEVWRGINNEMSIWEDAVKIAKQEGLKGDAYTKRVEELVAEPTQEMMDTAAKKAKYRVFQEDGKTEEVVRYFRDNLLVVNFGRLEKIPGIRKLGEFRPTRFIIPFVKTPINVVKFGAERSPLGVLPLVAKIGTGAPKEEVIEQAAKLMVGSAIMVPLAMYFTDGKITGAAPSDKKLKDAFFADGKQPWSVKIGDRWVAYNRVEPFNTLLSQIAIWHDAFEKNGEEVSVATISDYLRGFTRNFADQTFMTGLGNLMDAIEDPERFGQKFITDITGGFIPSFVAATARSTDQTVRKPETLLDSFMQRLPLVSKNVPAMPSAFEPGGEAKRHTQDTVVDNILSNFLGLRVSKDTGLDLLPKAEEVSKLNKESKEVAAEKSKVAEELYAELKAAKKEDRQAIVEKYKADGKLDEYTVKKFAEISQEKKLGELSADQKVIKGATSNRSKAIYVYGRLKEMDPDARNKYVNELLQKKIISESVIEELAKYVTERKTANLPLTK